jgi:transposase
MWDPSNYAGIQSLVMSIARKATDPEDIKELIFLEQLIAVKKGEIAKKLKNSGYSGREIARGAGVDEKSVRNWVADYERNGSSRLATVASVATRGTFEED